MNESENPEAKPSSNKSNAPPRIVPAERIFEGDREICIEHEGEIYRLRITRRNKLILQK
jgi:hemin uptake protein HemP